MPPDDDPVVLARTPYGRGELLFDRLRGGVAGDERDAGWRSQLIVLQRDLSALFNASGLGAGFDGMHLPRVTHSVLNYGLGSMAGVVVSSISLEAIARRIRRAIHDFEPRILRDGLRVYPLAPQDAATGRLVFVIEGLCRCLAGTVPFRVRSIWDTESGAVSVAVTRGAATDG
ncbi:type VI secretion system protein ImpF [Luteibacter rhizovicinus]|uniref:Type VI secretion system protein ImpF n=1 Tax=Luteibacter rhizovicinus TaxID=242606 RepID=A0A4R3YZH0_9GAMM|nr:GPW/gp25 family protein [Luteibacter rhizovicinus]TCV97298.1 type VI secretion system protein ImpF [Luteibacter rhizovicinus]